MEFESIVNTFSTIKDFSSDCFCFVSSDLIIYNQFCEVAAKELEAYYFKFGTWKKPAVKFNPPEVVFETWTKPELLSIAPEVVLKTSKNPRVLSNALEDIHAWHSLYAIPVDQMDTSNKSIKNRSLLGLVTAGDDFEYKLVRYNCDLTNIDTEEVTLSFEKSFPLSIFHSNVETVARFIENENADLYIVINWMLTKNPERTRFHVFKVMLDKSGKIEDIPLLIHLGQLGGYWYQPFVTAEPYAVNFLSAYGSPDEMMTVPLDGAGGLPQQHTIDGNSDTVGEAYPPSGVPSSTVRIRGDFVNIVYGMRSGNFEMWTLNWKMRKYTHRLLLPTSENQAEAEIEQSFLESAFAFHHALFVRQDEKHVTLDLEQISALYCQKKVRILYGGDVDKKRQCFDIMLHQAENGLNGPSKNQDMSEDEIKCIMVFVPEAMLENKFFSPVCRVFDLDELREEIKNDNESDLFIYDLSALDFGIKDFLQSRSGNTVIALSEVGVNRMQQPQDVFCWHCIGKVKVIEVPQKIGSIPSVPNKLVRQQGFLERAKLIFTSNYPNWEKDAKTTSIFVPELDDFIGKDNNDNKSNAIKRSRKRGHPESIFVSVSDDESTIRQHEKSLFNALKRKPIGGILINKLDINELIKLSKTVIAESESKEMEPEITSSDDSGNANFLFLRPFFGIYLVEIKEETKMEHSDKPHLSEHGETPEKIYAIQKVYKQITGSECSSEVYQIIWYPNESRAHVQSTKATPYFVKISEAVGIWQQIGKLINEVNDASDAEHFSSFVYALSSLWESSGSIGNNIMRVYKSLESKANQQHHSFKKNQLIYGPSDTGKQRLLTSYIVKASLEDKPFQNIRVMLPNHQLCTQYNMALQQRLKQEDKRIARTPIISTKFFADDSDDLFCAEIPLNNIIISFLRYRLTVSGSTTFCISNYEEETSEFRLQLEELCQPSQRYESDRKYEKLSLTEVARNSVGIVELCRSNWNHQLLGICEYQSFNKKLDALEHLRNEIKRHLPFSYGVAKQRRPDIEEMEPKHIAVITMTRELAMTVESYLSSAPSKIPCGSISDQLHDGGLIAVAVVQDAASFSWPYAIVLEDTNTPNSPDSIRLFAYSRAIAKLLVIQMGTKSVQTSTDVECQSMETNQIQEAPVEFSEHFLDEFKELQEKQLDWVQKFLPPRKQKIISFHESHIADFNRDGPSADFSGSTQKPGFYTERAATSTTH